MRAKQAIWFGLLSLILIPAAHAGGLVQEFSSDHHTRLDRRRDVVRPRRHWFLIDPMERVVGVFTAQAPSTIHHLNLLFKNLLQGALVE